MKTRKALAKGTAKISFIVLALASFGFLVYSFIMPAIASGATIWTDKPDYSPDEVVILSGNGFIPNALISITIIDPNNTTFEVFSSTDSSGSFVYFYDNGLMEGTYFVTVTDFTNTATTTFTDSRTTISATLNGASSVTVAPGATIIANVTGRLTSGDDWHSTGWRISTTTGAYTCVNTNDFDSNGNYSVVFNITAPGSAGTYNVYFRISGSNSDCTSETGTVLTMTGAVNVTQPACTDADGDHYFVQSSGCSGQPGFLGHNDCNDANAAIHPGATEVCNDQIDNNCNGLSDCADSTCKPCVTIVADKVLCNSEPDLPNWSGTSNSIDSSTAQNYVNAHQNCHLQSGWDFQWRFGGANPGDNLEYAPSPWNTFGPTDGSGRTNIVISKANSSLWFREALKPGYFQFTGVGGNSTTAEFYCDGDVLNYDNYDNLNGSSITDGSTFYCVAFNALTQVCGNGIIEGAEQCDGGTCCNTNCTFKSSSTVCRASSGSCDIAETCSGSSATCPANSYQPEGTDCGLCEACSAFGECNQIPLDDSSCGTIDCDGLDTTCRNYTDLTSGRCLTFGQCKSANSADCTDYTNAQEGTDCGLCEACSAFGECNQIPLDDSDCGAIECDTFDNGCRNYTDLTAGRCYTFGVCKSSTLTNCTDYTNAQEGTDCGLCESCNAFGECNQIPLDDLSCGTIDCDGLDTTCRNYNDLTSGRCLTFGQCKSANTEESCTDYTPIGCQSDSDCQEGQTCSNCQCGGTSWECTTDADCNDLNTCTNDYCSGSHQCVHIANTNTCNDGNSCTENDVCSQGSCSGTQIPGCSVTFAAPSMSPVLMVFLISSLAAIGIVGVKRIKV